MGNAATLLSGRASDQPVAADELEAKRVLLLLAQGFEDAEAAAVLDVLGWTKYRPSVATVDVDVAGVRPHVAGAFGLAFDVAVDVRGCGGDDGVPEDLGTLRADAADAAGAAADGAAGAGLAPADAIADGVAAADVAAAGAPEDSDTLLADAIACDYDALVIPGGFHNLGFDEAYGSDFRALARAFSQAGKPIATMCVGVLPVAEAGVLRGGRATTYTMSSRHDNAGRLRELGCEFVDEPVVESRGVISCAGPAYSEQVAALLLERVAGPEAAAEVMRYRSSGR